MAEWESCKGILGACAAAVGAILAIVVICMCIPCCQPQEAPVRDTVPLVVDTGNAAMMHRYGMPTKADVIHWHVSGEWGYGELMFEELPGKASAWDGLYGIEPSISFVKQVGDEG